MVLETDSLRDKCGNAFYKGNHTQEKKSGFNYLVAQIGLKVLRLPEPLYLTLYEVNKIFKHKLHPVNLLLQYMPLRGGYSARHERTN